PAFFAGLALTAYLAWLSGTLIGAGFSSLIPAVIARAMGVALYAMFIAIIVASGIGAATGVEEAA
ncbi:MAG TPA: hypothetical protein VHE79_13675, partial [Spirochaetia bacterium]